MSVRRNHRSATSVPEDAFPVARQALAESRLRGLPAAEEYRVISDRLYRSGVRDLAPGALLEWIEQAVEEDYERFLELRRLGERFHGAIAAGNISQATWELACELDPASRQRLIAGLQKLQGLEDGG